MSTKTPGAPAPIVTATKSFHLVNGQHLLSVNPDIPIAGALDEASGFVARTEELILNIIQDHDIPELWAAIHFSQMARLVIDASIAGLKGEVQQ
jgi:hypothetical protein